MRTGLILSIACAVVVLLDGVVAAADVVLVSQKARSFSVGTLRIAHGAVVHFDNDDRFVHQIYVESPTMTYESDEQVPGTSVEVRFPVAGRFEVRCHIHPKMLLRVDAQ